MLTSSTHYDTDFGGNTFASTNNVNIKISSHQPVSTTNVVESTLASFATHHRSLSADDSAGMQRQRHEHHYGSRNCESPPPSFYQQHHAPPFHPPQAQTQRQAQQVQGTQHVHTRSVSDLHSTVSYSRRRAATDHTGMLHAVHNEREQADRPHTPQARKYSKTLNVTTLPQAYAPASRAAAVQQWNRTRDSQTQVRTDAEDDDDDDDDDEEDEEDEEDFVTDDDPVRMMTAMEPMDPGAARRMSSLENEGEGLEATTERGRGTVRMLGRARGRAGETGLLGRLRSFRKRSDVNVNINVH